MSASADPAGADMKFSTKQLRDMIYMLDWTGHNELSNSDIEWLAEELALCLSGEKKGRCEVCDNLHEVIVETKLGDICETCLADMAEEARTTREGQEENDAD
jgi:hypothetical protein